MAVDRVWAIPVKKLDVSTLAGIFAPIQTGLNEACFLIRIVNDSNINLYISYDGATEHDYVESDDHIQLEFQAGAMPNNQRSLLPKGTIVYAKAAPGGTGYVYVSGYYVDRS